MVRLRTIFGLESTRLAEVLLMVLLLMLAATIPEL